MFTPIVVISASLMVVGGVSWIYWLRQKVALLTAQHQHLNKQGGNLLHRTRNESHQWRSRAETICSLFFHLSQKMVWPAKAQDLQLISFRLRHLFFKEEAVDEWPQDFLRNGGFRPLPELNYAQDNAGERSMEVNALIQHLDIDQLIAVGTLILLEEEMTLEQALMNIHITPLTPAAFE